MNLELYLRENLQKFAMSLSYVNIDKIILGLNKKLNFKFLLKCNCVRIWIVRRNNFQKREQAERQVVDERNIVRHRARTFLLLLLT